MNIGRYRNKIKRADRRRARIRHQIRGVPGRPRLVVSRSTRHMYAQVIDDQAGTTLLGMSSMSGVLELDGDKKSRCKQLGMLIAAKAKELGVEAVVFDRDRYPYHGRIRMFAEGAREGGLKF
jgi:large subunit ribosomal protein L18